MQEKTNSESLEEYVKFWKEKFSKKETLLQKRKQDLIKYANVCSNILKNEFNVERVYLIGSLARDLKIHEKSDIDLVVEGLDHKQYFDALNRLFTILPKSISVDLITKEKISDSIRKIIKNQGVRLK
ncbi:MAG: nucleotidyltransferase family protein [Promethearchaeia archaeon]